MLCTLVVEPMRKSYSHIAFALQCKNVSNKFNSSKFYNIISSFASMTNRPEIYHFYWSARFLLSWFDLHSSPLTMTMEMRYTLIRVRLWTLLKICFAFWNNNEMKTRNSERVDNWQYRQRQFDEKHMSESVWCPGFRSVNWTPGIRDKVNKTNWKMGKMAFDCWGRCEWRLTIPYWLNLNVSRCPVHFHCTAMHVFQTRSNLILSHKM